MKTQGRLNVELVQEKVAQGWQFVACHFYLERDLLTPLNPKFQIELILNGNAEDFQFLWTEEMAEYLLLTNPQKMASVKEEIERLGYVLYSNILSAEKNWGRLFA